MLQSPSTLQVHLRKQPPDAISAVKPTPNLNDFPALVFSGDRTLLGELPGEMTANAIFKFAMEDSRLPATKDFARSSCMPLPLWPLHQVQPFDAVCFVLSDAAHPAREVLIKKGALEYQHYILADAYFTAIHDTARHHRLSLFMSHLDSNSAGPIMLLGYGDQGAHIAAYLHEQFNIDPCHIIVMDDNVDSRRRAETSGHRFTSSIEFDQISAVIYSPLMRYEELHRSLDMAHEAGVPCFDNSNRAANPPHFHAIGRILLDAAATRAIEVDGTHLRLRNHGLPIETASLVREDQRRLGSHRISHITSGHRVLFPPPTCSFNCEPRSALDRLAPTTFEGLQHAFVSLRDRPDTAIFAARSLCERLWPDATARVFPAESAADLGRTRFERLLKRHLDGAEIIAASQSSAQQVVLGIAANQFAANHPIIEIGSALGGSGMLMAAATDLHRPDLFSIDPETATRHVMRWAFQQQDQLDRLHQLIQTSDDAILQLHHLRNKVGVLFVDGLHTEAATLSDFMNYSALIKPGGALFIHDVEPARFSVLRVVVEHVLADHRFIPHCLVDGLLVLERTT